jgi:hypothetical protein
MVERPPKILESSSEMAEVTTQPAAVSANAEASAPDIEVELDRLSLGQALQDVELANGRVVDLAHRLLSASEELARTRRKLDDLRSEHVELEQLLQRMRNRRTVRLADTLAAVRRALRT